jgi:hypothetical protein
VRCVFSSPGTKCAKTADAEIKTGVTTQCTTQRADAQIPRLSVDKAETRKEMPINKKIFPVEDQSAQNTTTSLRYCNSIISKEFCLEAGLSISLSARELNLPA